MSAGTVVRVRRDSDAVSVVDVDVVGARHLEGAVPWRRFRGYRGQVHLPGTYWSVRAGAHVGYESLLELANLMLIDFDPDVEQIVSQPFLLDGVDGARRRRHVPDFLVRLGDGRVRVVDVKPAHRLTVAKVRGSLEWTRRLMAQIGWEYEICSEPHPVLVTNVRFLAGFRWADRYDPDEVDRVRGVIGDLVPFRDAVSRAAEAAGTARRARAVLLHLLWRRELVTDLYRRLDADSLVWRA